MLEANPHRFSVERRGRAKAKNSRLGLRTCTVASGARCEGISVLDPVCENDPYPRYKPGEYEVRCVEAKTYRDPRHRRFVCRLRCTLVDDPQREVYGFANLGAGEKPKAGRGSKYWRYWVTANGGPPRKRQVMGARVFEGKVFLARLSVVEKRSDGTDHVEGEKYSTIQEIISRRWP